MDPQELLAPLQKVGGNLQKMGAGLVLLGALAIALPEFSGMTVSVVVGVLLVTGGILRLIFTFLSMGWGSFFGKLLVAIITIAAGAYMIANPNVGSRALAITLTAYLFLDGITTVLFALRLPAGGVGMIIGGLISILAGVLMYMQWPASGDLAVGVLVGIKLVVDGIVLIAVGSAARSAAAG